MPVTYPLSLKVSVWLLLNLLLIAAAGVTFYLVQFGHGWNSLAAGALGDRMQATALTIVQDVYAAPAAERDVALLEHGERTGVTLYLFNNDGQQVHGPAIALPAPVEAHVLRPPRRGGPPDRGGRGGPPGPGPGGIIGPVGRGGAGGPVGPGSPYGGRLVHRTSSPTDTWIALRVPLPRENGPPIPGTMVIRAPNLIAVLRVMDVLPWLGLAFAAAGLSLLFWLPLVSGMTRALRRLSHATEAIAQGRFETRIAETRHDELGQLGRSVNLMAERLATLVNGQKRFLGDVAHELGSPIGRLRVATEILEDRADPSLQEYVRDVREEVQQMSLLVNELLAFTQAGLRPREVELSRVEVDSLLNSVLEREDPGARVRREIDPGLAVNGDAKLLERAIGNLVRNALRYAGDDAEITLSAKRSGPQTIIIVEDTGPGVPQSALARLGEPFFRPETARARETGGVGLGLAIVRSSVTANGGEIHFSNRSPHGFRAELRLLSA